MMELPSDLIKFLQEGKQLEYQVEDCECGSVKLLPLGKHFYDKLEVDGQSLYGIAEDPNEGIHGYYIVPAINLIASCEDYGPEHILSWIPDLNLYITYDVDHQGILAFPKATWQDIATNPLRYLNAQWDSPSIGEPFVPWPRYPFQ
ncbi:Hypothetical protein PBC10988_26460 [Planctomycetales bacterium 10988]|nr:Hypothetical protein PBC10988_26460 [Planctomycetales bacterium 10988]